MSYRCFGALAVCGVLLAGVPVIAHHALQAQYDFEKPFEFEGVLVKMEYVNPHSMMHLEVTAADGSKTVWIFQMEAAGNLRRRGLARELKVGDTYAATGFAARNGKSMGFLKTLKMPDGRMLTMWFGDPNG